MKNQNLKKYPGERVYAEGFGPESKLVKFLKTPVPPKTAGIVSLLIAAGLIVSGISVFPLFFQSPRIDQTALIKAAQTQTVKTTTVVANGNPVEWTTLVKRSDIKSGQYLLKLPKTATNIKISTITAKQAKDILKAKPKEQLSLKQRQSIAVAMQKKSTAGLFARLTTFLFADLEQAASDLVQNIVETITQPENPEVTSTPDATIVDLSNQILIPAETPAPIETPAETPAPTEITPIACDSDSDCSLGQACDNSSCTTVVTPTPTETPESPTETPTLTLTTINITPLIVSLIVGGTTQQLTAETLDQNGAHIDAAITWLSDNTAVATVDDNGLVAPVSEGTANITASSGSVTSSVSSVITVSSVPTETPALTPASEIPTPVEPKPISEAVDTSNLSKDIASAQTIYDNAVVGGPEGYPFGQYSQDAKDTLKAAIDSAIAAKDNTKATQSNIDSAVVSLDAAVATFQASNQTLNDQTPDEYVEVTYETPAPTITEEKTNTGKLVTVSAQYESPNQPQLTDVLAFTTIPEIYKVGQESKIHIKWKNNDDQNIEFQAYDTDNNGKLDYLEWTVPHLSDQIFEIIFISKAFQLDESQNIIADIYDTVQAKDGNYATIPDGNYVRVTFEQILNSARDNTIYAKPTNPSQSVSIEVYPVYTDQDGNTTEGPLIATFPSIDHQDTYKILLTNLQTPTDVFDMKVTGNADIDYIVDPTPATVTDNFDNSSKIASSSGVTVANGVVALSASSTWTCGSDLVDSRDAQTYTTILIGSQCWMRKNLNVGVRVNASVTQTTTCAASDGSDIQKHCYSDDPTYCTTYGGLYQWNQTMCGSTTAGAQGICPAGWHIPTHDEWTTLERAVCTSVSCTTDFPYDNSTTGWRGTNEGTNLRTVDATHFSGLLAGYSGGGLSYNLSSAAYFWSSLQSGTSAWTRYLDSGFATVYRYTYDKAYGFSVRCLKN